jgi:hypothetical protein
MDVQAVDSSENDYRCPSLILGAMGHTMGTVFSPGLDNPKGPVSNSTIQGGQHRSTGSELQDVGHASILISCSNS